MVSNFCYILQENIRIASKIKSLRFILHPSQVIIHWLSCHPTTQRLYYYYYYYFLQSHYKPREALRVSGDWGFQISRQSALEGGKVVSPTYRPPLLEEIFLVLISVGDWVIPRTRVLQEGLRQWIIRMVPSEIKPAAFRLVSQCLNHCATTQEVEAPRF
jgi:hypothetical protein